MVSFLLFDPQMKKSKDNYNDQRGFIFLFQVCFFPILKWSLRFDEAVVSLNPSSKSNLELH